MNKLRSLILTKPIQTDFRFLIVVLQWHLLDPGAGGLRCRRIQLYRRLWRLLGKCLAEPDRGFGQLPIRASYG